MERPNASKVELYDAHTELWSILPHHLKNPRCNRDPVVLAANQDTTVRVCLSMGSTELPTKLPLNALNLENYNHTYDNSGFAAHHFRLPVANLDARSIWLCLVASLAALSLSSLRSMMVLPLSSLVFEHASTSLGQRSLIIILYMR